MRVRITVEGHTYQALTEAMDAALEQFLDGAQDVTTTLEQVEDAAATDSTAVGVVDGEVATWPVYRLTHTYDVSPVGAPEPDPVVEVGEQADDPAPTEPTG
jgi:hypothetical protein